MLGKAEKLGLIDTSDTPAIPMDDESSLGKLLLAIVSSARAAGLEPERAPCEATRELQEKFARSSSAPTTMPGLLGLTSCSGTTIQNLTTFQPTQYIVPMGLRGYFQFSI